MSALHLTIFLQWMVHVSCLLVGHFTTLITCTQAMLLACCGGIHVCFCVFVCTKTEKFWSEMDVTW